MRLKGGLYQYFELVIFQGFKFLCPPLDPPLPISSQARGLMFCLIFLSIFTLYTKALEVLVSLHRCESLSELTLVIYLINLSKSCLLAILFYAGTGELTTCPSSFAEISILGFVSMY